METPDLTFAEAQKIIQSFNVDQLRKWSARTDTERLAIGVIVLDRVLRGRSLRNIGEELGVSYATVARYRDRALQAIILPTVDEARREMLEQLTVMLSAVWPGVEAGDDKAITSAMKILERRAKLIGADSPVRVEAAVTETTQADMELREMLQEAKARNATERAESY